MVVLHINYFNYSSVKITYTGKINKEIVRIKNVKENILLTNFKISIVVYLDNNITSEEFKSKEDSKKEMEGEKEDNPFYDSFTLEIEDNHKKDEIINTIENLNHINKVIG